MHSEYAVEPAAIGADWNTFRFLIEKFGFDKGRLISRLPPKWEKEVLAAAADAGVSDIKLASMVERLKATRKIRVVDFGRAYDPDNPWIENALREHAARPFRAIICSDKPTGCAEALVSDDCDEENALIEAQISRDVGRVAADIADALFGLVAPATEVDIVDPFFDLRPAKGDFMGPLAALLAKLSGAGFGGKTIKIHFRTHDSRPPDILLARDAPRLTKGMIPVGFKLQLYEWEQIAGGEDFHDRFVLTNGGGLMIGAGPAAAGAAENATFTLLADAHAQVVRAKFSDGATVYRRVGAIVQIDSSGNAKLI
ncbi:hypothetical protein [Frigidibacter sp. ROC022]|uniref:hypothetical protein n=1 Tax=Frigidibacter sp. ROC022 TaxID=2971796 RepID=UPI00215B3250|nr:hypothetical protein [Frigidibacter sp. ROC022]MCR8726677.1 hypothetical protein [Frigidibacter sp. ROC022]